MSQHLQLYQICCWILWINLSLSRSLSLSLSLFLSPSLSLSPLPLFLLLSLSLFDNQRPFLVTPQLARGLQVDYSTLEACAYCREAKGMYGSIG